MDDNVGNSRLSHTPDKQTADILFWIGIGICGLFVTFRWTDFEEERARFERLYNFCKEQPAPIALSLIATIAVTMGLQNRGRDYYTLLHIYLCGASLFLMVGGQVILDDWVKWLLGAFAVLYNPIFPIYLRDKDLWIYANLVTVIAFWIAIFRNKKR
jgi:hypothetical protein